ncbi:Transmembrane channel-like protein 7 [Habropoda laboriosa]|uniref:Transmembrane channel-like protein 7 n=1 Tax=Habropoda laboriosa TaxID=597456 RepID=A0A0L7QMH2_9HYME|nr:Transmembrane channel-like protein 7 [Habropoda laboriosa]
MSGGERKKRACDRGQGWEEAGAEFYQESYPAAIEADLQQALQRDPSHIATLLPSKKSRVATAKRIRNDTKTTLRRRTSTRSRGTTTSRRMSTNIHDAAVSMLPDLSENLSNEERTWEEIMQIKAMPVCMAQKIQLKNQLQSATKLRLQGFEQLKWQRRKAWQQFRIRMKETYSKMELWNDSLKTIGGNFGMGIVAYFLFIKWLMYLNVLLFSIMFLFIVLPAILLHMPDEEPCINSNNSHSISCCSELYWNITQESSSIAAFVEGTGILEYSLLFYGAYSHLTYDTSGMFYNLPLSYISATIGVFIISLIAIVKSAARSFKQRVVENEGQFYQYCNLVFGGWDYSIHNEKSAVVKHKALHNEMKAFLEAERLEEEKQNRTREEKTKLFLMRLSLIAKHTENKVLRFFGEQEFDLPKQVLDVVYLQTICWLGFFFAPLLPLVAVIVSVANKHMVTVLKNQLVLEGHDKQFLLNRLSAFIKQQQDQNKYHQEQTNELGTFS